MSITQYTLHPAKLILSISNCGWIYQHIMMGKTIAVWLCQFIKWWIIRIAFQPRIYLFPRAYWRWGRCQYTSHPPTNIAAKYLWPQKNRTCTWSTSRHLNQINGRLPWHYLSHKKRVSPCFPPIANPNQSSPPYNPSPTSTNLLITCGSSVTYLSLGRTRRTLWVWTLLMHWGRCWIATSRWRISRIVWWSLSEARMTSANILLC